MSVYIGDIGGPMERIDHEDESGLHRIAGISTGDSV